MKWHILIVALILLMSCDGNKPKQLDRLPKNEIPGYREATMKMSEYIMLKDSTYYFTISKDKAIELGIPAKYYDRMQQELDYTNYIVREEYNKKGIPIEMSEFK